MKDYGPIRWIADSNRVRSRAYSNVRVLGGLQDARLAEPPNRRTVERFPLCTK